MCHLTKLIFILSFAFYENISCNKVLIGQDREHFTDIRDIVSLAFKLLTALNALFIPAKFCGVFQWSMKPNFCLQRHWDTEMNWQEDEIFFLAANLTLLVITEPVLSEWMSVSRIKQSWQATWPLQDWFQWMFSNFVNAMRLMGTCTISFRDLAHTPPR